MEKPRSWNFLITRFFLLFLLFLVGCAPQMEKAQPIILPQAKDADLQGTLVFALAGEVSILNPLLSTDSSSSAVEGAIFSGLTTVNEKLEIVPDLARSWTVSPDGKIWTFYLRPKVKWHNGVEFTSQDVKFTFDKLIDPKVNTVRRSSYIINGRPIQTKIIDRYTVQFILPQPFAPFLSNCGMGILPYHILKGQDINISSFNRSPIGTGPFKFDSWKMGEYIKVVRHKDYYLGNPKLSAIVYKIIPNADSILAALEAGEVDEAGVSAKDYKRIKAKKGINVFEYDSLTYTYLGLNLAHPLFADKRVRQALAYATDKDKLVKLLFKGLASPAWAPLAPQSWAYSDQVKTYPYSIEKAKELLAQAGLSQGFEFTVLVNQGNKEREKAAIVLQQMYKKINVKMNIQVLEWSTLIKKVNAFSDPKPFDAVIIGWSLGLDPDGYSIWHSSQYPRGFNFIKYRNIKLDQLLEAGRTTMPKEKRKKIYAKISQIITEDQPYVFLWYPKAVAAISQRVGGLSQPGPAGLFLNMHQVFVTK